MSGAETLTSGAAPAVSTRGPRKFLPLLVLAGLSVLSMLLAVAIGSVPIPLTDVLAVVRGEGTPLHQTLIIDLRAPRALAALPWVVCWQWPVP